MRLTPLTSRWRWLMLVIWLPLAACVTVPRSSLPVADLPSEWAEREAVLQSWSRFDLRGKVSIAQGEESLVASLRWRQRGEQLRLSLDGPLGVGGAEWSFDSTRSDAVVAELEQRLGVAFPIGSIRYWALGVPDPLLEVQSVEVIAERLNALQQGGWSIRYLDYAPVPGARFVLPKRLQLESAQVRVRLFIESWEPLGP